MGDDSPADVHAADAADSDAVGSACPADGLRPGSAEAADPDSACPDRGAVYPGLGSAFQDSDSV
jgi:hypothetical protein